MTEKRKPLTRQQFGFLIIKQDCLCGCGCGRKLDFSAPLFSSGGNELDNRALWLTECSTRKTAKEAPDRAKVRRFEQKKTQADKRAEGRRPVQADEGAGLSGITQIQRRGKIL